MNPYIGDRQLEPQDEYECPHCGAVFMSSAALKLHAIRCPEKDDVELEVDYDD